MKNEKLLKKLIQAVLKEKTKVTEVKIENSKIIYKVEGYEAFLTIKHHEFIDRLFLWLFKHQEGRNNENMH